MISPATGLATTSYPPNANSRTFDGGKGGWDDDVEFGGVLGGLGVCGVGEILCPTITNERMASGGNPNGYLNTRGSGAIALSSAGSVWASPSFEYRGDKGKKPDLLRFSMDGLADIGGLLAALPGGVNDALNNVTQSVAIVNDDNPADVVQVVVPEAPLSQILGISSTELSEIIAGTTEPTWETATVGLVSTSSLKLGDWYRIRVATEYSGLAGIGVLPQFNVGLDNVELKALTGGDPGARGAPGSGGKKGQDGKSGAVLTQKTLLRTVKRQMPKRATVSRDGKWIRIREVCPRKFKRRCVIRTLARFKRRGPAVTRANRRVVGKGVRRTKALLVKPRFRAKAKKAKRVFIQATVKVGKVKVRVVKPARLVKR